MLKIILFVVIFIITLSQIQAPSTVIYDNQIVPYEDISPYVYSPQNVSQLVSCGDNVVSVSAVTHCRTPPCMVEYKSLFRSSRSQGSKTCFKLGSEPISSLNSQFSYQLEVVSSTSKLVCSDIYKTDEPVYVTRTRCDCPVFGNGQCHKLPNGGLYPLPGMVNLNYVHQSGTSGSCSYGGPIEHCASVSFTPPIRFTTCRVSNIVEDQTLRITNTVTQKKADFQVNSNADYSFEFEGVTFRVFKSVSDLDYLRNKVVLADKGNFLLSNEPFNMIGEYDMLKHGYVQTHSGKLFMSGSNILNSFTYGPVGCSVIDPRSTMKLSEAVPRLSTKLPFMSSLFNVTGREWASTSKSLFYTSSYEEFGIFVNSLTFNSTSGRNVVNNIQFIQNSFVLGHHVLMYPFYALVVTSYGHDVGKIDYDGQSSTFKITAPISSAMVRSRCVKVIINKPSTVDVPDQFGVIFHEFCLGQEPLLQVSDFSLLAPVPSSSIQEMLITTRRSVSVRSDSCVPDSFSYSSFKNNSFSLYFSSKKKGICVIQFNSTFQTYSFDVDGKSSMVLPIMSPIYSPVLTTFCGTDGSANMLCLEVIMNLEYSVNRDFGNSTKPGTIWEYFLHQWEVFVSYIRSFFPSPETMTLDNSWLVWLSAISLTGTVFYLVASFILVVIGTIVRLASFDYAGRVLQFFGLIPFKIVMWLFGLVWNVFSNIFKLFTEKSVVTTPSSVANNKWRGSNQKELFTNVVRSPQ